MNILIETYFTNADEDDYERSKKENKKYNSHKKRLHAFIASLINGGFYPVYRDWLQIGEVDDEVEFFIGSRTIKSKNGVTIFEYEVSLTQW